MVQTITRAEFNVYQKDFLKFDKDENGALEGEECVALARHQLKDAATDEQIQQLITEFGDQLTARTLMPEEAHLI